MPFNLPNLGLAGLAIFDSVGILGVVFQGSFNFVTHVDGILKFCSQRILLLKQLRDQGMPLQQLHVIFQTIILISFSGSLLW